MKKNRRLSIGIMFFVVSALVWMMIDHPAFLMRL